MLKKFFLCYLIVFHCFFLETVHDQPPCGRFKFSSNRVTAPENSELKVPFQLTTDQCPGSDLQDYDITISRKHDDGSFTHICVIKEASGQCLTPLGTVGCTCSPNPGKYLFSKTAECADNATWAWWTDKRIAEMQEVEVNVLCESAFTALNTDPPVITEMPFRNSESQKIVGPVPPGTPVSVVCSLINGHEPESIHPTPWDQSQFATSPAAVGDLKYDPKRTVSCSDAGRYHCEGTDGSEKSATLLVECPPEFPGEEMKSFSMSDTSESQSIEFNVKMHSTTIKTCLLTLIRASAPGSQDSRSSDRTESFLHCESKISGTPPDLTLTVPLDGMTRAKEGQWRLMVQNEQGTGQVDFCLHVTEKGAKQKLASGDVDRNCRIKVFGTGGSAVKEEGEESDNSAAIIAPVLVSVVVLIVIIVIIIVVGLKVRGRCSRKEEDPSPRHQNPDQTVGLQELITERRRTANSHIYSEIPELIVDDGADYATADEYCEPVPQASRRSRPETGIYDVTNSTYGILNPVYDSLRDAYGRLRRLSQRLSRRLSRRPPSEVVEDPNVY